MQTADQVVPHATSTPATIDIELLALDLTTCTRCVGTLANIEKALQTVRPVLESVGTQVRVETVLIETEEQALRHRFAVSPTVRVDGRDIAFETLQSECQSCTDLCGCQEGTSCRVWRYRGQDYTEAPVGLVVESVLGAIFGGRADGTGEVRADPEVPENLRRFFRGRSQADPAVQATCCEPDEKASCCDASQPETCGCA